MVRVEEDEDCGCQFQDHPLEGKINSVHPIILNINKWEVIRPSYLGMKIKRRKRYTSLGLERSLRYPAKMNIYPTVVVDIR